MREAFELIFGNSTSAVLARDPSGRIMFANAAAARLLGRDSSAELIGVSENELSLGSARFHTTNICDESGALRFALLTHDEGTPHKLLEEVVRQLPAGVVCAEIPSGKVMVVNEQTFRIWNTSWVPPTTSVDFPTFNGLFTEKHSDPDRWPLIRTMKREETVTGEEMEILRDDGSIAFIRVNSAPVRDRAGKMIAAVTTYYDITDEKRRETERQRLLEQLAVLAEASAGLSASLNYEATLASLGRLAVPRFADCCAVTLRDAEGASESLVLLAHVDRERELALSAELSGAALVTHKPRASSLLLADVSQARLDELSVKLADLLRKADAKSALIVPLAIRQEILGEVVFLVTSRRYDRVDQETAEEVVRRLAAGVDNARLYRAAQDANRMKDEFLATLSHELRTPLAGIFSWGDLLSKGELDEASRAQAADAIMRSARSQARLIDDLLDVSRIVTGKLEVKLRPTELQPVVSAAVEALQMASVAKGIRLETALECADAKILGDPERLKQIAWNLLSNAIKFTPRGGRVRVELARIDGRARLSVSDTGSGISPAFLPHVFDRFRQADSSSTRAHSGLGLGLAIVRHLVERHEGTVQAESAGAGSGSTFTVLLPLLLTNAPEECAQRAPLPSIDPAALRGLVVLVVDDQVDALRGLTLALEQYGAQVVAAASVRDALSALEWARPHVVVSDIAMPGEDGYALIRVLRGGSIEHATRTPAIALTAYASEDDRQRTREAGYQSHLAKPIQPVELAAAIMALVGSEVD